MRTILLYGMNDKRREELKKFFEEMDYSKYCHFMDEKMLNQKVGYAMNCNGYFYEEKSAFKGDLSGIEFALFSGLDRKDIFNLIDKMKEQGIKTPVMALITPTNIDWIMGELISQVNDEHIAMTQGVVSEKK